MPSDPTPPPYEAPDPLTDPDRPSAAAPSKAVLEAEAVTGRHARDPYAALRIPAFRNFVVAFFLSSAGAQIQRTAVAYEVFHKTKSEASLGTLGLMLALPMLLLSLPAGQLADTTSRKKLFLFMQVTTSIAAMGLMLVSHGHHGEGTGVWPIYALLAFSAVGGTIGRPGREALMAGTVPNKVYPNAVTWNSTGFEVSSMGGPAVGGLILWLGTPAVAYAVSMAFFVIAFGLILRVPDARPEPKLEADGRPIHAAGLADLLAGLRFVFSSRLLLAVLTLDMFAVLFGGATFVLPAVAANVLHVGPLGFGILEAAPAIGAVSMALVQAHRRPYERAGRTLLWAVAGFGAAIIGFGLSTNYLLSFAMLVLIGVFDNISVVIRHSLVPLLTPDRMRGRVLAVNQIFVGSSNDLGGLESGMAAKYMGLVPSIVFGGVMSMGVVAAVAWAFPEVRRLKRLDRVEPIDEAPSAPTPTRPVSNPSNTA